MKTKMRFMIINAMIACVYAAFTFICSPLSYGAIQLRFAEILMLLAFYNRRYIPGLVVGCFFANAFSPMGVYDMIFGTLATLLTCLAMMSVSHLLVGAFFGALFNGAIVGSELYFLLDLPFWINAGYVFIGEAIVLIIGAAVFKILEKNQTFMNTYIYLDK